MGCVEAQLGRTGKRTAQVAVRIAVELANEGLITRGEAVQRVTPEQVDVFLHPPSSWPLTSLIGPLPPRDSTSRPGLRWDRSASTLTWR